jgi:predicted AlkP superfamily pyrophosphatase or phosphodiesterase
VRKKILFQVDVAVVLWLMLLAGFPSWGRSDYPHRPKLVIMLVIDQLRFDYLVRFQPNFIDGGFKLLLEGGANFVDCKYDYSSTETGPGHATLATGTYANIHGIVANEWYDQASRKRVYCVNDPEVKQTGGRGGSGASPRNLLVSTLGDELRLATDFESKVFSLSGKDRAAVLLGGHTANAAYWFRTDGGGFVSSTYYMQSLPNWVNEFNRQIPTQPYCGKPWRALVETPGVGGKVLTEFEPAANEPCPDDKFFAWLELTPFENEVILRFAEHVLRNENLGHGSAPDLLAISLSANDYVGHAFGPYSPEVADTTLRTDRYLAEFFAALDRQVGLQNVWIVLSADHGVAPTPAFIKDHKLGLGRFDPKALRTAVERALSTAFGQDRWVEDFDDRSIYLNLAALDKHRIEREKAEKVAADAATSVPGVWAAWTRTQFMTGSLPDSPLARKASNSFYGQRSPDVFIVVQSFATPADTDTTATHGTPWNYDSQVPLVFWGSAFKPGTYTTPCQTIDLAPTLAAALGLTQPSGAQGHPLAEAIK